MPLTGEYLPEQLRKTKRCRPYLYQQAGTSGTFTTIGAIEMIIVPFFARKRKALDLDTSHPALVLFDCFQGQTTSDITSLVKKHHVVSAQIPANCTDKIQPMDIAMNKPDRVKDELQARFQSWYVCHQSPKANSSLFP